MSAMEEQDESYFVSMTDLMVGMLFIFVIMLMAFVLNLRQAEQANDTAVDAVANAQTTRGQIIDQIRAALRERGVAVDVDWEHGVLHLPEEILFASGSADLSPQGVINLGVLASVLRNVLPCFSTAPQGIPALGCNPILAGRLEAILIEGHTDSDPVSPSAWYRSNLGLSAFRAINTYDRIASADPAMAGFRNDRGEALFGVSGYGERRRRQLEERTDADKRLNRRIDLRFLMATPRPAELAEVERRAGVTGQGVPGPGVTGPGVQQPAPKPASNQ